MWRFGRLIHLQLAVLFMGCAGPTTPLGAPWATDSSQLRNGPLSFIASIFKKSPTEIRFSPHHQVLHGATPITVVVRDPAGIKSNYKLVVRHNGLDVTPSFLRQSEVTQTENEVTIKVPVVRLSPEQEHVIEVIYASELNAYARYVPPICRVFDQRIIVSTAGFKPDPKIMRLIERISRETGFNPAFTTALIAQESAFNPQSVSWAKAIGLTQVTPLAETEVTNMFSSWPRYPGINEMPAFFVRAMVMSGRVNDGNEWRINVERSIRGGLAFVRTIVDRWNTPENYKKIQQIYGKGNPEYGEDVDAWMTRLVLASYNSGYSRVSTAFARDGAAWMRAPELKEARRYVNRITSYCEHFSVQDAANQEAPEFKPEPTEDRHENET